MKFRLLSFVFSLVIPLLITSSATGAPSDFDGDGKSDPASVEIISSGKLNWKVIVKEEEIGVARRFGQLGVHLMAANYRNLGVTDAAYVDQNGKWYISNDDAAVQTFTHGADKATYMGGADVDGDGIYDAMYHTNTCKKKQNAVLHVLTDPLRRQGAYSVEGGPGNQFTTYGDVNGDPFDDFCWLEPLGPKKKRNGRFRMKCKDVITGTLVAKFRVGTVFSRPLPIKRGEKSPVYFAFSRTYKKKQKTVVKVINTSGETVLSGITFNGTGHLLVGDYLGQGGMEQLALAQNSHYTVYDLVSRSFSTISSPSGIAFDEINIEHFDSTLNNCHCTTRKIKKNKTCPGASNSRCQVNRPISDGFGGWLHKPHSDSTGSLVNLFPSNENPENCRYETSRGKLVSEGYFSGRANGNREHWRPRNGGSCSSYPKNLVVTCKVNGKQHCWKIPDPCNRYD